MIASWFLMLHSVCMYLQSRSARDTKRTLPAVVQNYGGQNKGQMGHGCPIIWLDSLHLLVLAYSTHPLHHRVWKSTLPTDSTAARSPCMRPFGPDKRGSRWGVGAALCSYLSSA
ncbi:hypothetical protein DFH11DRAFT_1558032 [Phellopilus nigrolimitatus]|nr:hypothetical protein DFH11DRAFT_1558032 [Phellopilus nigrolimitatus]